MKLRWFAALAAMVIVLPNGAVLAAQTDYAIGGVAASELSLPLGARAIGMGGAFTAVADDADATAWNPAGLAQATMVSAGFAHRLHLEDTSQEYLAAASGLLPGMGVGGYLTYFNYGAFERLTLGPGGLPEEAGSFTPTALTAALGWGQWFLPGVAAGAAVKYYTQTIDTETYSAAAVDVGALVKPGVAGLRVGACVKNLGSQVADASLPAAAAVGAAFDIPAGLGEGDAWLAALDVEIPFGDTNYTALHVGTEYLYNDLLAVRLGYNLKDQGDLGGLAGLSAGAGARLKVLSLDYALASFGDLGLTHHFSVGVEF